jgi:transposase InsO family protein
MAQNTFYHQQKTMQVRDKYADLKARIRAIYDQHKGRYGYRRITVALRQQGKLINHKTVQGLMDQLQLKSLVRVKKYRVFRGLMRRVEPNILAKDFEAGQPNEKWITDVAEINVESEKLYPSPVMDLFDG